MVDEAVTPRDGAVRYRDSFGDLIVVDRHQPLFSTALMLAEDVFVDGAWEPFIGAQTEGNDHVG